METLKYTFVPSFTFMNCTVCNFMKSSSYADTVCIKIMVQNHSIQHHFIWQNCAQNQSATLLNNIPNCSHTTLFCFVSFGIDLYTPRRIARSPTAVLFIGEKPLCWSTYHLPAKCACSGSLVVTNRYLTKRFMKVGLAPAH